MMQMIAVLGIAIAVVCAGLIIFSMEFMAIYHQDKINNKHYLYSAIALCIITALIWLGYLIQLNKAVNLL